MHDERPIYGRLSRGQLVAADCLAALGFLGVLLGLRQNQTGAPADWLDFVVIAAIGLPLAVRRLAPVPVFAAVLLATLVAYRLDIVRDSFAAAAFALYMVALIVRKHRREPTMVIGIVSALGVLTLGLGTPGTSPAQPPEWWTDGVAQVALGSWILGAAWTLGRAVRERRAYVRQLAEQAVAQERLRIARELHDIVAHSMSLIAVQAGVANHVAQARPEEATAALRVIEQTSRNALTEMRQALGVLRADAGSEVGVGSNGAAAGTSTDLGAAVGAGAEFAPAPGLSGLDELADRAAMAGVVVKLDVRDVDGLPASTQLAVYRIVQEALTNVVKHAAPARCQVSVAASEGEVCVDVTDDGSGRGVVPNGVGHGLVGMRERVGLYGGSFSAGPRAEGGFAVQARWRLA
ncbi:sensor histidine kinase [Flindersiella endophytica]